MSLPTAWALVPAIAGGVTAGVLVVVDGRRTALVTLGLQYLFVAWLAELALPLPVAATKLLAGWTACGILAVSCAVQGWAVPPRDIQALPGGRAFRVIAVLLVAAAAAGLGRGNWAALPAVTPAALLGAALLMALGLLQMGLSEEPFRVGLGLLTLLGGYEAVYCAVEPSLAVQALLAAVHIGLALVVAYLMTLPQAQATLERGGG